MKNLNTYFDKAKNLKINKAIIPNDEIRIVLGKVEKINLPKADKYNNDFIHFLRKYKMTIISSAVLALSFAAFLNTDKIEIIPQVKKKQDIAIVNKDTNLNKIENTNQEETKQTKVNIIEHNNIDSIITLPFLKLTDEELSKIGINRVGSGYSFLGQQQLSIYDEKSKKRLLDAGYNILNLNSYESFDHIIGIDGIKKSEIVQYSGWDNSKPNPTYSIAFFASYFKKDGSIRNYSAGFGGLPMIYVNGNYFDYNLQNFIYNFSIIELYDKESVDVNKNIYPYASQLVFVKIKLDSADTKSRALFCFVPTKEFVNSLPKRYLNIIKEKYVITDSIKNNEEFNKVVIKANEKKTMIVNDQRVKPTKIMELNKVESEKIGIVFKKNQIQIINESEIDFSINDEKTNKIKSILKINGIKYKLEKMILRKPINIMFDKNEEKEELFSVNVSHSKIVPVAVNSFNHIFERNQYVKKDVISIANDAAPLLKTNDSIFIQQLKNIDDERYLDFVRHAVIVDKTTYKETSLVNKLLPIKIIIGDSTKKVEGNKYSEVIVWFVPTPEFVGALPDRYRSEIEAELNIIAKVESGLTNQDELCKEAKVGFFNICNNDNNIKSVNAYPNPVQNEINLEFKLDKKAKVSINLKDISGKMIKNFITDLYLDNKSFSQKLSLEGITQGMYLLEIKSSDGSIVIQKILKN